ncbi:hypothetical protein A1Q2_08432 [Trichosporon asahii var. asahii CBS 8904]|uniref:Uncharacterized protein n=2 Tax=Trichosporon asahii var. asahii TaxID=189963 RepID=K1V049_TRIAC|nr:hypothetical protein A1Q1_01162 [Trichosporon asahii var. asahii CBS 2479]EJT49664.1 hypothetical protein A1Q1_01162 [Trichosporon asahii var. asahii CBS 2479]EKC97274.1 hypothetical protein A1Q2_08432 [Trichosporon asahii var. asahii CBS 8904]
MSKVDFEYYPHLVDIIWEHISEPITVYTAGQVCSSWRQRFLKVIYRYLSAQPDDAGSSFWTKADRGAYFLKYYLPNAKAENNQRDFEFAFKVAPALDTASATRLTHSLDVFWPDYKPKRRIATELTKTFPALRTMRVHTTSEGLLDGVGSTQVYSWYSRSASRISIAARGAETLVLLITVETPLVVHALLGDDIGLHHQLEKECYSASQVVVILQPDEPPRQDSTVRPWSETWACTSASAVLPSTSLWVERRASLNTGPGRASRPSRRLYWDNWRCTGGTRFDS